MKPEIARKLISHLAGLSARCDDIERKIAAAEDILQRYPDLNKVYQQTLNERKRHGHFPRSALALEALEKELSQD